MFRQNSKLKQGDLFNDIACQLKGKSYDIFCDEVRWHNVFKNQVFNQIDETKFAVLFADKKGAPNFPINIIVGMMILKEGFGWSDSQLFEAVRFNVLVRSALGMKDFAQAAPSAASYYNLKKSIAKYDLEKQMDLMSEVFVGLTKGQIIFFNIDGESIRMDSKLLGSNIARVSRFELVHSVVKKFYLQLNDEVKAILPEELTKKLISIKGEDGEKTVYRSKDNELADKLMMLGNILYQLVKLYENQDVDNYELIKTIFDQQFKVLDEKVELKPKEELKASNIQSAQDVDCAYRKKEDQQIFGGYSANVTETCSKNNKLSIITVPDVKPATASDKDFYVSGVEKTKLVTGQQVKEAFADGAYNSQENQAFNEKEKIEMVLTGLQGKEGRLGFEYVGDQLIVTDKETGTKLEVSLTPKGKSYKVEIEGKPRYIKPKEIESYFFRQQMQSIPIERRNRRNNVEATMFQISFFTRNNKVRYRGLKQVQTWLNLRCLWINLVRIKNYLASLCPKSSKTAINGGILGANFIENTIFMILGRIFNLLNIVNTFRIRWVF